MPKTKTKKTALASRPKLKFDKTLLAVIAAVVVAVGGYLFYQASHASAGPFVTYTTIAPIKHDTGKLNPFRKITVAGVNGDAPFLPANGVWEWGTTSPDSKTVFLQYGPYATINMPGTAYGLHVCYYYSATNDAGRSGYIKVYHDLSLSVPSASHIILEPLYHPQPVNVTEDLVRDPNVFPVRAHCYNYATGGLGKITNVEARIKVVGGSDAYSHLGIWKTTFGYF